MRIRCWTRRSGKRSNNARPTLMESSLALPPIRSLPFSLMYENVEFIDSLLWRRKMFRLKEEKEVVQRERREVSWGF